MTKPRAYADLFNLPEDERVAAIGHVAATSIVGCVTDDEPGKPERYIEKVTKRFPLVRFIDRSPGPVPNTVTLRFGPKNN